MHAQWPKREGTQPTATGGYQIGPHSSTTAQCPYSSRSSKPGVPGLTYFADVADSRRRSRSSLHLSKSSGGGIGAVVACGGFWPLSSKAWPSSTLCEKPSAVISTLPRFTVTIVRSPSWSVSTRYLPGLCTVIAPLGVSTSTAFPEGNS